jgi:hypothetical protein
MVPTIYMVYTLYVIYVANPHMDRLKIKGLVEEKLQPEVVAMLGTSPATRVVGQRKEKHKVFE